jgi:Polyketide cyclase / dehydrase and lipid transport
MRYYQATSTIAASPEAVWAVLSDGASWPSWDSGVDAVEGRIAVNETVKIRSHAASGRAFPVRVTRFDPRLTCGSAGGCRSVCSAASAPTRCPRERTARSRSGCAREYSGPLLLLIWRSMPDPGPSFERFARGLKQRVDESGG